MKLIAMILAGSILTVTVAGDDPEGGYVPKEGLVPTKEVAIKIAVAVWEPIYGDREIAREKPYKATLDDKGVWTVKGSLPEGWKGGVAEARISMEDGRILSVVHGK